MEPREDTSSQAHVVIQGRVQGVGFRYAAQREAHLLGLSGWVRNLPGGEVEALFEGPRNTLESMVKWCEQGPAYAQVSAVRVSWTQGPPAHTSFQIRS